MPGLQSCFVSTFPPRKCGLATFTEDLAEAMAGLKLGPEPWVVAITHADRPLGYDERVRYEIRQEDEASYVAAARWLNASPVDVVMIEHEYGIFGGEYGSYVLTLLKNLTKPTLVTLHTVLPEPRREQADIMRALAKYGDGMVSLAEKGREILMRRYGILGKKIHVIRHGVPPAPEAKPAVLKEKYGLAGKEVLSTFGLLHPGKGIEYALRALPAVVTKHPETVYLVLGQTHPEVQKRYGETYVEGLHRQVRQLGISNNVVFVNRYLSQEELMDYLALTDIYITPYLNPEQISSGPLAYAVAMGKAVVSTPYLCAKELLADGRGLLVPFKSSDAMSQALLELVGNKAVRRQVAGRAAAFGQSLSWEAVAKRYLELMEQVAAEAAENEQGLRAGSYGSGTPRLSGS